ncbi:MAG: hypothetical protein KKA05_01545 [Alphaproteobacteria bacterium]|nr:hypothetical protein [Alphaproteobacteria bacterium]MBU0858625.1 hypothetical protein [Alphaproteobacteria bacterium]
MSLIYGVLAILMALSWGLSLVTAFLFGLRASAVAAQRRQDAYLMAIKGMWEKWRSKNDGLSECKPTDNAVGAASAEIAN